MKLKNRLLFRMFGRPRGLLGRLGGRLMTGDDKREMAEWVLSEINIEPTDHVVEVGFGPGLDIEAATAVTSEGFVAGIDYSREMVDMARERNLTAINEGHVDLRYSPAANLPYEDAAFDKAFSINSMMVWPDAVDGLREIRRVLKPGGQVALAFTSVANQTEDDVRPLLAEVRFTEIRVRKRENGFCMLAAI